MAAFKVLSIDWDYFVDCPIDFKMKHFPDGGNENLPEPILDQVWMLRYGQCSTLKDVNVDICELVKLRMLLKAIVTPYTMIVISDSHKDIYKYLEELKQTKLPMELYNIDFHHDMYDFQDANVDCGNWLRLFMNSNNRHDNDSFTWIRRKDSGLSGDDLIDDNSIVGLPKDIAAPFQLVFLCRSGVWSPPHLDKDFLSLCRYMNKLNDKAVVVDQKVTRNRYNRQFKNNVSHYVNTLKKIMKELESSSQ